MKLTIKRNQADVKGFFGGHKGVNFSLYGRSEITNEELTLINKYKVGGFVLAKYKIPSKLDGADPIDIRISVAEIIAGMSVETDDINTLLELEKAMKDGCVNLKNLLAVMATFGGEEVFNI